MSWLLMLLCAFSSPALAHVCTDSGDPKEIATTIDWEAYQIERHPYPYQNLIALQPLLETVSANTGQPIEVVASVIAWETGARIQNGKSLRGGRDDRFWGPGQVGCGGGGNTYSWLGMLRKWMNAPRLQCEDLLDPYIGTTAAMLVLNHIQDEMAFRALHEKAQKHKDRGLFRLLHAKNGVYHGFRRPGGLDSVTQQKFTEALITYGVEIPLEAALTVYSGGNLSYCERKNWDCRYTTSVMRWVEVSRKLFRPRGTRISSRSLHPERRVL